MQFDNRLVLITGGASGLGKGIALVMAQKGADIALVDVNAKNLESAKAEISHCDIDIRSYTADVTRRSEISDVIDSMSGYVDILVNAAGVIGAVGFEDTQRSREEDWDLTHSINVKGTVICSEVVAEDMKKRRSGKIVNIASHAGRRGSAELGAYGASKAAVIHLTQSFALDLAPYNINVNVVCPGTIWTPMWERIAERNRRIDPEKNQLTGRQVFEMAIQERCPLGREQTPEDIGKAVAFFASDDAINITGQSLNVNGGTIMN